MGRKIKWKSFSQDNLPKLSTEKLKAILNHNISYIEMVSRNAQNSHNEERLYDALNPVSEELNKREEQNKSVQQQKGEFMTRDQVNQAVEIALQALGNKKTNSIRKACKVAGITPTTLYNKTTDEQREAARAGKYKPEQKVEAPTAPRKRGRPARQNTNPSLPRTESRTSPQYVAKLERALLKRILDKEE